MFTGIIEAVGTIESVEDRGVDKCFVINTGKLDLSDISIGASICVNGVCLTVIKLLADGFMTDVSAETLSCTTLGNLTEKSRVNLEKALRLSDRLGGHIVSGHVDGVGTILDLHEDGRSTRFEIEAPENIARYICKKGSICIDGTSLTVNDVVRNRFAVNIIPHTMDETIFSDYKNGADVNLEADVIARYLERLYRDT